MTTMEPPPGQNLNATRECDEDESILETQRAFIRRHLTEDRICILTFDRPESKANIFDRVTLEQLNTHLNAIANMPQLRGLILVSGKSNIFVAGADIHSMSGNAKKDDVRRIVELGQRVFNRLATLPLPKVAAINGACLGGGFEICLACDYRIASTDKSSKIGLPETKLGIIPGWGGTTRLPRLIGLPAALDIILGGKVVSSKSALKRGMVDEVIAKERVLEAAFRIINTRGSGLLSRKKSLKLRLVNSGLFAWLIRGRLRTSLNRKTKGHYPAIMKALDVATRGICKSVENSLLLERGAILELSQTQVCRNLIGVFYLQERAKKIAAKASTANRKIQKLAVVGAGVMGSGIAQWASSRNIQVILRDIDKDQVAKGMANIAKIYADGAKRRVFDAIEVQSGLDRVYPSAEEVPLKNAELVIEAAVERMDLKKSIYHRLANLTKSDTILATNTSALSVSDLAEGIPHPQRVIGIHFFNPVHRMQLVEVVVGNQTSPEVVQRTLCFVHQIGKLPVLVKDSPGFLVNRVLMPYLVEAGNLFEQGASIEDIDNCMLDFGMPMGPLRLLDEVGIDVAKHVASTLSDCFPERFKTPQVLEEMMREGMLGRKSGSGFFQYAKGKKHNLPNPKVTRLRPRGRTSLDPLMKLQKRMVLLMINEASRCLEEEVVQSPADVDFGMIMGTGFAPFRGGPLRHADSCGIKNIVQDMEQLVESGQLHFTPSDLLHTMAKENKQFYTDNGE